MTNTSLHEYRIRKTTDVTLATVIAYRFAQACSLFVCLCYRVNRAVNTPNEPTCSAAVFFIVRVIGSINFVCLNRNESIGSFIEGQFKLVEHLYIATPPTSLARPSSI